MEMELVKTQFVRLLLLLVLPDRCAGDMLWEIFKSAKRVSAGVREGRPYRQCLCFGRKVTSLASNRTFVR